MTEEDLKDFVIVVTEGGSTWIGEAGPRQMPMAGMPSILKNAFVLRVQQIQGPNGEIAMHRSLWPLEAVCGHPSLIMDTVSVTPASWRYLCDLDPGERAEILRWMQGAEQIRAQARASKAGIVLAGGMPKPS